MTTLLLHNIYSDHKSTKAKVILVQAICEAYGKLISEYFKTCTYVYVLVKPHHR